MSLCDSELVIITYKCVSLIIEYLDYQCSTQKKETRILELSQPPRFMSKEKEIHIFVVYVISLFII